MIEKVQTTVLRFTCEQQACRRQWTGEPDAVLIPERCPSCRSRAWQGQKRQSHVNEIVMPAPRRGGRPRTRPEEEDE